MSTVTETAATSLHPLLGLLIGRLEEAQVEEPLVVASATVRRWRKKGADNGLALVRSSQDVLQEAVASLNGAGHGNGFISHALAEALTIEAEQRSAVAEGLVGPLRDKDETVRGRAIAMAQKALGIDEADPAVLAEALAESSPFDRVLIEAFGLRQPPPRRFAGFIPCPQCNSFRMPDANCPNCGHGPIETPSETSMEQVDALGQVDSLGHVDAFISEAAESDDLDQIAGAIAQASQEIEAAVKAGDEAKATALRLARVKLIARGREIDPEAFKGIADETDEQALQETEEQPEILVEAAAAVADGGVIARGAESDPALVRDLQARLGELGHRVDQHGRFDEYTEMGVRAFQEKHGMEPTGKVDARTVELLRDPSVAEAAPAAKGAQPPKGDILTPAQLSDALASLGYEGESHASLRKLQKLYGLPTTGTLDGKTMKLLGRLGAAGTAATEETEEGKMEPIQESASTWEEIKHPRARGGKFRVALGEHVLNGHETVGSVQGIGGPGGTKYDAHSPTQHLGTYDTMEAAARAVLEHHLSQQKGRTTAADLMGEKAMLGGIAGTREQHYHSMRQEGVEHEAALYSALHAQKLTDEEHAAHNIHYGSDLSTKNLVAKASQEGPGGRHEFTKGDPKAQAVQDEYVAANAAVMDAEKGKDAAKLKQARARWEAAKVALKGLREAEVEELLSEASFSSGGFDTNTPVRQSYGGINGLLGVADDGDGDDDTGGMAGGLTSGTDDVWGGSETRTPPNLRDADPSSYAMCQTCVHFNGKKLCSLFSAGVDADDLCDSWLSLTPVDLQQAGIEFIDRFVSFSEARTEGDPAKMSAAAENLRRARALVEGAVEAGGEFRTAVLNLVAGGSDMAAARVTARDKLTERLIGLAARNLTYDSLRESEARCPQCDLVQPLDALDAACMECGTDLLTVGGAKLLESRLDAAEVEVLDGWLALSEFEAGSEDYDDAYWLVEASFSADERQKLADKGHALPDGSYPIRSVGDLKNAIQAIGRAKNGERVKAWIIKRAKALKATNLLPDDWGAALQEATLVLAEVKSDVYPKLERVPGKQNWVDYAGGLPDYIERIAKHIHYEHGHPIGAAIAMAVGTVKRWCAGGAVAASAKGGVSKTHHVDADTKAKACAAVAEWEAKKKAGGAVERGAHAAKKGAKLQEAHVFDPSNPGVLAVVEAVREIEDLDLPIPPISDEQAHTYLVEALSHFHEFPHTIHFDPALHHRNRRGEFTDMLSRLMAGQHGAEVTLPHGVSVRRRMGGMKLDVHGPNGKIGSFGSAEKAADAALHATGIPDRGAHAPFMAQRGTRFAVAFDEGTPTSVPDIAKAAFVRPRVMTGKNLSVAPNGMNGSTVFSYDEPIAHIDYGTKTAHVNMHRYSATTSGHRNMVRSEAEAAGFKVHEIDRAESRRRAGLDPNEEFVKTVGSEKSGVGAPGEWQEIPTLGGLGTQHMRKLPNGTSEVLTKFPGDSYWNHMEVSRKGHVKRSSAVSNEQIERMLSGEQAGSVHLQGIGRVPATRAADVKAGQHRYHNNGESREITNVEHKGGWVHITTVSDGKEYTRKHRPDSLIPVGDVPWRGAAQRADTGSDMSVSEMFHTSAGAAVKSGLASDSSVIRTKAQSSEKVLGMLRSGELQAGDGDYRAALDRLNKASGTADRSVLQSQLESIQGLALGRLSRGDVKADTGVPDVDHIRHETVGRKDLGKKLANGTYLEGKAELVKIPGNQHAHFSVTGTLWKSEGHAKGARADHAILTSGAIGDMVGKQFPEIATVAKLHLADENGVPMHAEANGWYWYSDYDGKGGTRPPEDWKDLTPRERAARYLRVAPGELPEGMSREQFKHYVETLKPQWAAEAGEAKRALGIDGGTHEKLGINLADKGNTGVEKADGPYTVRIPRPGSHVYPAVENGAELLAQVKTGTRVTILTPQGQERSGRAVMRSSGGGWVLNMGGAHGTPGVVDERNIVRIGGKRTLREAAADIVALNANLAADPNVATLLRTEEASFARLPLARVILDHGRKFRPELRTELREMLADCASKEDSEKRLEEARQAESPALVTLYETLIQAIE